MLRPRAGLLLTLVGMLLFAGCMRGDDDDATPAPAAASATATATLVGRSGMTVAPSSGTKTATTRSDDNASPTPDATPLAPVLPSGTSTSDEQTEPQRPTPKLDVTPAGSPEPMATGTATPVPTWIPTVQAMLTATTIAEGWCAPETAQPIIERFVAAFNAGDREALLALLPDASASSALDPNAGTMLDSWEDPTLLYTFQIYYEDTAMIDLATPDTGKPPEEAAAADWLMARHAAGEQWEMAGITFDEARQRRVLQIPEVSEASFGLRLTATDREPWTMMVLVQVNCEAELVITWRMLEAALVGEWE